MSMAVVTTISSLGVIHFVMAMRTVEADVAEAEGQIISHDNEAPKATAAP